MAEVIDFSQIMYTEFEPKMKNQFLMEIPELPNIPAYMIKTAAKPSIQFEVVTLDHINVKRKLKGKGEWQDVEITLYDPIVPSAAQAVMEWVRMSHESITGRDGYSGMYKKTVDFYQLGPVGDKVEHWQLVGAFISSVNFGDVDYSSGADPVEISITLSYDYAVLEF